MNRRFLLSGLTAAALMAAAPAFGGVEEDVRKQLKAQGFKSITVTRTLLGRSRITATRRHGIREIILNPQTGEVLRDQWTNPETDDSRPGLLGDDHSGDDGNDSGDDGGGDDGGGEGGEGEGGGDD